MTNFLGKGPKTRLILPFATPSENRTKDFTKNMEMAAILYLAESSREKGENLILRKPEEKLVFITEAYYPIWLIPYHTTTLIFDGIGVTSHTFSHDTIPNTKTFNKDIQENQQTTEAYAAALIRNTDYFSNFTGKEEKTIKGLITTSDLIQDFTTYLQQMKETQEPFTTKAILIPTIDDCEIQDDIEQLENLRAEIGRDIENLDESMRLLNTTTLERTKTIQQEIKKTQETHNKLIEKTQPKVARKVQQIQNKYHRKIARTYKRYNKRLQLLHKNQVKFQKTLRYLRTEVKRCETRIQHGRRRRKKHGETQWTLKLKRIKKRLPTLHKEIEDTIKGIQICETIKQHELAQQKTEYEKRIEAANKIIRDLQASKEAEITMRRQEIATLEDTTANITKQMNEIAKTKKTTLNEFDTIAMPRRTPAYTLVYMPFYLARYETENKKRYVIYPPSKVGDMGILIKMRGTLGATRMKALLQPRSVAMTTFLNRLVTLIEKDPMLEKEVTEAGIQASVLLTKQLRIGLKKGLKELEDEKWLSENELQTFNKLIYVYA